MNAPLRTGIDLRLGDWRTALVDVEQVDCLISDPPYSARTHEGMRVGHALTGSGNPYTRTGVQYARWNDDDVSGFVSAWLQRVRGWFVVITDHVLAPTFAELFERAGRYAFAPIPFVELGKQPRLTGDGPTSWTCWIVVSRPRTVAFSRWGSLDGAYVPPTGCGIQNDRYIKGGKPLWLMRRLVRDYSRPGDLIADPCAGGATTLIAAVMEGRRAVGAELDPDTYAKACARCAEYPVDLTGTQQALFGGERGA